MHKFVNGKNAKLAENPSLSKSSKQKQSNVHAKALKFPTTGFGFGVQLEPSRIAEVDRAGLRDDHHYRNERSRSPSIFGTTYTESVSDSNQPVGFSNQAAAGVLAHEEHCDENTSPQANEGSEDEHDVVDDSDIDGAASQEQLQYTVDSSTLHPEVCAMLGHTKPKRPPSLQDDSYPSTTSGEISLSQSHKPDKPSIKPHVSASKSFRTTEHMGPITSRTQLDMSRQFHRAEYQRDALREHYERREHGRDTQSRQERNDAFALPLQNGQSDVYPNRQAVRQRDIQQPQPGTSVDVGIALVQNDIDRQSRFARMQSPLGTYNTIRRQSLDYEADVLQQMHFDGLKNESFDNDPQHSSLELSEEGRLPLSERLQRGLNFDVNQQCEFFDSMTQRDWESSGEWISEQAKAMLDRIRACRQRRVSLALDFERRITGRQDAVKLEQHRLDTELQEMRKNGALVLTDRTPKRKR